jgi:hypothetical protein
MKPMEDLPTILQRHVTALMEHCDSVRIFVTVNERDGEVSCTEGSGSFKAQMGHVREWIIRQEENVRLHTRDNYYLDKPQQIEDDQ